MSSETTKNNDDSNTNSWMGPKGFDEAKYYKDEKYEIGIKHSDERIKAQIEEALSRNEKLADTNIEVEVKNGVVTLRGDIQGNEEFKEASDSIHHLSGVKTVKNLLSF